MIVECDTAVLWLVDPLGIAIRVLVAVVPIVPVENVQAAVGAGLLHDRHEPGVVGREEIGLGPPR